MEDRDVRGYSDELLRVVDMFRQRIVAGTSDPENFLTISDIERLWTELRGDTSLIYSDMLSELLSAKARLIRSMNLAARQFTFDLFFKPFIQYISVLPRRLR